MGVVRGGRRRELGRTARPRFVELPFGAVRDDPHSRDAGSHLPYVSFGSPEAKVRVQGRIDRIDVGRRGGQRRLRSSITKRGPGRRFETREKSKRESPCNWRFICPPRTSGILNPDASPFQIVYWNLTLSGCVSALKGGARGGKLQTPAPDVVADIEPRCTMLFRRSRNGYGPANSP